MADRGKDKDASKALVSLLLRNSTDNDLRQKLIRFCHVNFGTGRLNDLTRPQLQMALSWLDQQTQAATQVTDELTTSKLNFIEFLKTYPKEIAACFIAGFLVGSFFF